MTKRLVSFFAVLLFSTVGIAQHCTLSGATQMAPNTPFAVGPTVYAGVVAIPEVGTAIVAARDAWDVTDAVNRVGDWSGVTSGSDCPAGQPYQIGAFGFGGSTCATLSAYGIGGNVLAFVDYFSSLCPQCGTKSLTVNLDFPWSLNPLPGEYDFQSVVAHEYGHVLGLAHMENGACTFTTQFGPSCADSPNRETMGRNTYPAEVCMRDLSANDIASANWFY
jgi:hypothetical protein